MLPQMNLHILATTEPNSPNLHYSYSEQSSYSLVVCAQ